MGETSADKADEGVFQGQAPASAKPRKPRRPNRTCGALTRDKSGERVARAYREAQVCRLYLEGKYQHEIAARLKISIATVIRDIKAAEKRWIEQAADSVAKARALELAKINALERTYRKAWVRSIRPVEETTSGRSTTGDKETTRAEVKRKHRDGNPAFLTGIQWCVDRRCKLLGLDVVLSSAEGDEETVRVVSGLDINLILGIAPEPEGFLTSDIREVRAVPIEDRSNVDNADDANDARTDADAREGPADHRGE